ncbi:MAG: YidC/Oxa1 family membrane protein insertase [Patescibacteria group bacterium]
MFEKFFIQPIYNILVLIAANLSQPNLGVSVIVLVIFLRLLLWPFFHKAIVSQAVIKKIQPEVERIRKVYKNDQVAQTKELLALYKKNNFNPFSSFLGLLIQLPVLIALYQVFLRTTNGVELSLLYPGVPRLGELQTLFLGAFELTQANLIFSLIAALLQGGYSFLLSKTQKQGLTEITMLLLSPLITFAVVSRLPSVIALYWSVTTIISIFQQLITERLIKKANERVS